MPTKRTLRKRKRQPEGVLTSAVHFALATGSDIVGAFPDLTERELEEKLDQLWRIHGPEVLREFIAGSPTERPALWWKHDAPERRPRLEHEDNGSNFDLFMRAKQQQRIKEVEILVRHGLLTADEKRTFEVPGGGGENERGKRWGRS